MRTILEWIVAFALIFLVAGTWYITQPLAVSIINESENMLVRNNWNSTMSLQTYSILRYMANLWPVPLALALLLWAYISSQRQDWESRVYG